MCSQCINTISVRPGDASGAVVGYAMSTTTQSNSMTTTLNIGTLTKAVNTLREQASSPGTYFDNRYRYYEDPFYNYDKWQKLIDEYLERNNAIRKAMEETYQYVGIDLGYSNNKKEEEVIDIRRELKKLAKGEDDVLLEDYGIVDSEGNLTEDGEAEVLSRLLGTVKAELVADLKKIDEKKKKKSK